MLFFKKNKPKLTELIPQDFIDIHSHLLPGIDDGAKTIQDSVELITQMQAIGFSHFMATPHTFKGYYDNTKEGILKTHSETKEMLSENKITDSLRVASEYLMDDHFVELFKKNDVLTLKENYILVEMSYLNAPINLFDILFDLQVAGYKPVLAHPERYNFYHSQIESYKRLKKAGCLFQLNLLSTVGYYGSKVQDTAQELLKLGLIDFVGSDVHHSKHTKAFENKVEIKALDALKEAIENNSFFKI